MIGGMNMNKETIRKQADREMKLSECKNMMYVMAKAMIDRYGFYTCEIEGEKVFITA
jgi:hypothetical protein